jgi:hypothetical protein
MSLFSLLCVPLVFFLRRSDPINGKNSIWALPLGGVVGAILYFTGPLLVPGAFGFSRWISGFVDIVSLPVLIPLIFCFALVMLKKFPTTVDYAGFILMWLIPLAVIHSMSGNLPSPIPLILVPVLWIAQALGIPFFISCIVKKPRWYVIVPSALGIIAMPIISTTSWWAFFVNRLPMGFLFLGATLIPAIISIIMSEREMVVNEEEAVSNEEEAASNEQNK